MIGSNVWDVYQGDSTFKANFTVRATKSDFKVEKIWDEFDEKKDATNNIAMLNEQQPKFSMVFNKLIHTGKTATGATTGCGANGMQSGGNSIHPCAS